MSSRIALPFLLMALTAICLTTTSVRGQDAPPAEGNPPQDDAGDDASTDGESADQPEGAPAADSDDGSPESGESDTSNPSESDDEGESEGDVNDNGKPNDIEIEGQPDDAEDERAVTPRKRASHPNDLEYPELTYDVPSREGMRQELANGSALWWSQEPSVAGLAPIFRLTAVIRYSTLNDPADKKGLTSLATSMLREGGTENYSREELVSALELRAASISAGSSEDSVTLSLTCLDGDRELGLELFDEVLRRPAFNQEDLNRRRQQVRESLKQRNTSPRDIESREWARLLYGDHPVGLRTTRDTLKAITRDDMVNWHGEVFQPQNMLFYGSGSLSAEAAAEVLNTLFEGWQAGEESSTIAVPKPEQDVTPGVYLMDRDQEQAHIRVGHVAYQREYEDYYPLLLMNFALGGGGFSSRITQTIRVENGLSYISYSRVGMPEHYRGSFYAACQTKNATASLAAKLLIEEINGVYENGLTEEELRMAKQAYLGAFPQRFADPGSSARIYGLGEYLGRPDDYQQNWRESIEAVTLEQVNAVAKKYLQPDGLVVYILGKADQVEAGNPDDTERATTLDDLGMPLTRMPLPDPESLTVKE